MDPIYIKKIFSQLLASLCLIFLNVIKAITGQRNTQAAQEAKTFNICRQKISENIRKVFSEKRMGRLLAQTTRDTHFTGVCRIFSTLFKVQLLIRRWSSERQENDLSIWLILMSTDRLSLRSNALMIMDHLYPILHTSPKNIRSKLLSNPRRGRIWLVSTSF